jgi:predicted nucleic acid-binding Zn finger protein
MKRERVVRLTGKPGNWVAVELAHESDQPDKVVAVATTYEAVVRKLEAAGKTDSVTLFQVPPRNCALIL